jgi:hypothetical protein
MALATRKGARSNHPGPEALGNSLLQVELKGWALRGHATNIICSYGGLRREAVCSYGASLVFFVNP